jgi:hypothetical protein
MATKPCEHPNRCPECGAEVSGGRAGCERLFDEVLARDFGDDRYAREHRLLVDAYSLQHPDEYMRSAKSYAAHLTGAYIAVELGNATEANRAVQQWLNGSRALLRPGQPEPGKRGILTILDVHITTDPDEHVRRVREWARTVWAAWRSYHRIAKQWTDAAAGARDR